MVLNESVEVCHGFFPLFHPPTSPHNHLGEMVPSDTDMKVLHSCCYSLVSTGLDMK